MKDFLGHAVEVGDYLVDAHRTMHSASLQIVQVEEQFDDRPDLEDFCGVILHDGSRESYYTHYGYRLTKEDATLYLLQRNIQ